MAAIAFVALQPAVAQSFSVEAPRVVSEGETFNVVFTAIGNAKDFSAPSFEGFRVLVGPMPSSMTNISIINGKREEIRQESFTYTLTTTAVGKFTIGPASVKIERKEYRSEPYSIEVVKGDAASSVGSDGNELFLRLSVDKSRVVTGEPVIATLKLYCRDINLSGFENVKFPTFNGFWSQEIETPSNITFERENLDGKVYNSALLRRYLLVPQQSGSLKIDPSEIVCLVRERASGGTNSIFEEFFDSYQTKRKRIVSPEVTVRVADLPSGAPASFKGAVGDYKIDARVSTESLKAHEAASLIVTLSGSGNLNMVEAPVVVFPPDFEVYDTKKEDKIENGRFGSSGSRSFEYPFIPRSHGEFLLAPIEFSFYDTKKERYVTLSTKPLNLEIEAAESDFGAVTDNGGISKKSVENLNEDIRFISVSSKGVREERPLFVASSLFWGAIAIVVLLFLLFIILKNRDIRRKGDVAATRGRRAEKVARARVKQASAFLRQNLYGAFYEELHKAVEGYIADKFSLEVADLSRERIALELSSRGKDQSTTDDLFALLDACEYARYAPSSGTEAMEKDYQGAIKVISDIER